MSNADLKLHYSPRSPFVRKVMIVLHETGLIDEVTLVPALVALHLPPKPEVLADNPLGKIPTLVTHDGSSLYDSRVICEYLDRRAGADLFPGDFDARMAQLRWQALGDGLTDLLLLWRTELSRPSGAWTAVTDGWLAKARAILSEMEHDADGLANMPFGIGQISLICALGHLDYRWSDCDWREHAPRMAVLLEAWSARPSVRAVPRPDIAASDGPDVTVGQLTFRD